jgi:hypothetical protein
MRVILFLSFIILATNGQFQQRDQQQMLPMMQNTFQPDFDNGLQLQSAIRIPFPQCLSTERAASILNPSTLLNLFQTKLQAEERKLRQERVRNDDLNNSMY